GGLRHGAASFPRSSIFHFPFSFRSRRVVVLRQRAFEQRMPFGLGGVGRAPVAEIVFSQRPAEKDLPPLAASGELDAAGVGIAEDAAQVFELADVAAKRLFVAADVFFDLLELFGVDRTFPPL